MSPTPSIRTVLVIDDDEPFRDALRELLEQIGITVHSAADAAAGTQELETGRFDVVFTDIRMPGDGFSVLGAARDRGVQTPVIMITGSTSAEWKARAETEGAFAYLIKPVGKEQILSVLRRAFERGRGPAELSARCAVPVGEAMRAGVRA